MSAKRLPDWIHACVEALVRAYLVVGGASPAVGVVMCGGGMCGGGSGIALRYLAVRRPFLKHLFNASNWAEQAPRSTPSR